MIAQRPRLLVTGATGVLGSAFVGLSQSYPAHEFVFVSRRELDLRDSSAVSAFVSSRRIRKIVHLAAISGGIDLARRFPARILRDNVAMTFSILDAAVAHRVDKVVLTLSSGMYPASAPQPNTEDQIHDGPPHESAYSYAMAKRLMEPAIRAYRTEHGLDVIGLVPSGIYGPNDNYNADDCTWIAGLVRRFCEWNASQGDLSIWGDGTPLREITFAPDMAHAFMWCLANHSSEKILNVGCGEARTIRDVALLLAEICGVPESRIRFDPNRTRGIDRRVTDNTSFRTASGFEYTDLRQGLVQTVEWFRRTLAVSPDAIRRWPRIEAE
ncbi:NAD-dependent epimerase/dehydratase family protein [Sphingomonas daechungensis]|uniref:NAD-dependent epimerase/dehydratase family protein n=1 Tax=Sphingomonas daechungensis TaxID=1176646 RepID=UPI0037843B1A